MLPNNRTIIFIDISGFAEAVNSYNMSHHANGFLENFHNKLEKYFLNSEIKYLGDGAMIISVEEHLEVILESVQDLKSDFLSDWERLKNEIGSQHNLELKFGITKGTISELSKNLSGMISIKDYISPSINLAAKLCSLAKPHGIIIHKISFPDLPDDLKDRFSEHKIKNKSVLSKEDEIRIWATDTVILSSDEVQIQSYNLEIHVTALAFKNDKLLLCYRSEGREIQASKWSSPGGSILDRNSLEDSIKQKFYDEVGVEIEKLKVIDTYYIGSLKIPGIVFYAQTKDGTPFNKDGKSKDIKLFEREELNSIRDELVPTESSINEAFNWHFAVKKRAIRLRIIISSLCNFACEYCHNENISIPVISNIKNLKETLRELIEQFDVYSLTFTGGEPFVKDNIHSLFTLLEFVRIELGYNKHISIITNGVLIEKAIIQELLPYNISLKVSLYALTNGNAEYTNRKDNKYIEKIFNLFQELQRTHIQYAINIPLIDTISKDSESFIEILKAKQLNPVNIKFIEMVHPQGKKFQNFKERCPRLEDFKFYKEHEQYSSYQDESFKNKRLLNYKNKKIIFFKYPCGDPQNCFHCFDKWDMIVTPDGKLQYCTNLLLNTEINRCLSNLKKIDTVQKKYQEIYNKSE